MTYFIKFPIKNQAPLQKIKNSQIVWESLFLFSHLLLDFLHFGIAPIQLHELVVGALFDDLSGIEDQDLVGILNGGEAVGDDKGGPALLDHFQGLDMGCFQSLRINMGGGFIQD